jgi:hypothetical protein
VKIEQYITCGESKALYTLSVFKRFVAGCYMQVMCSVMLKMLTAIYININFMLYICCAVVFLYANFNTALLHTIFRLHISVMNFGTIRELQSCFMCMTPVASYCA